MSLTPRGGDTAPYATSSFDYINTPRPSSAPSRSSLTLDFAKLRDGSGGLDYSQTSRSGRLDWNKTRNPITGEGDYSPGRGGKKQIPSYYDAIQSGNNRTRGKGKAQDVDISRAGLPTFITRIRVREGDIYHKRPSTAPSPTTTTSSDSTLYPAPSNPIPESPYKPKGRRPCQIPHLATKRNPLLENDDNAHKHRPMSKTNHESNSEAPVTVKKINIQHATHQMRPGFIPMDEPSTPPVRLRPFVPDDNEDVFYYRHAQGICPPDRAILQQRETEQVVQEERLQQAQKDRKVELNDQIQKHKERMERYNRRKNGIVSK